MLFRPLEPTDKDLLAANFQRLSPESRFEAIARVKCFKSWVLGENRTIQQLLMDMGARPGRWEAGTLEMTVPIPEDPDALEATPAPLILKTVAEGASPDGCVRTSRSCYTKVSR